MFTKSLEQIAKKMFVDFAMRKSGLWLDWRYLSSERRLSWVKEVSETMLECITVLEKDLTLPPQPASPFSSGGYERGFVAGQEREWNRAKLRLETMKEQINNQLQDFIEKEAEKDAD